MIEIIKELNIEVSKPNGFQAVVAKQYDMNTRFIKATFVDGSDKIFIDPNATVKVVINALRPDGESKGFEGEVNDDGTVTVPLHSWMLELVGTVTCDISVIDIETDDNKKLTTTSFTLYVEKAAFGGDDITTDPQYDVLVSLMDAATVAQEALDKSNEANAKYNACVQATKEAEAVVTEWQNEIDRTNGRIDELVEMRGTGAVGVYDIDGHFVRGTIKSNGAVAQLAATISGIHDMEGDGSEFYTDYCIPPQLMPMYAAEVDAGSWWDAWISPQDVNEAGYGRIYICYIHEEEGVQMPDSTRAICLYDLASVSIPEVADIRVGYDGTEYDTAGEAVRSQIKAVREEMASGAGVVEVDQTFKGPSENAQSGYAVMEAIEGYIDDDYTPTSYNAQSGVAVAQALALNVPKVDQHYSTAGTNAISGAGVTEAIMGYIDQNYNAESPNAASGKAVAEALATVSVGGSKPMRLIAKGTLTEAVKTIVVDRDMDGNPFEIGDQIDIYVDAKAVEKSNSLFVGFTSGVATMGEYITFLTGGLNTARRFSMFHLWYNGGFWDSFGRCSADGAYYSTIGGMPNGRNKTNPTTTKVAIGGGCDLPVGTVYEIYGRDA